MAENRATFVVAPELLLDALHLPPDTQILDVRFDRWRGDVIEFVVNHPDLPESHLGCVVPLAVPTFERDESGQVRFVGWGV